VIDSPRLTFAIPFYKNLHYLDCALRSVRSQNNNCWEVIVLDDLGELGAEALVASFKDNRFRYVCNKRNLGLAGNWNKCLALSQTEFVTILHADDLLMPNYVDLMLQVMDRHLDAAIGHCRSQIIDKNGRLFLSLIDEVKRLIRPRSKSDLLTRGDLGLASLLGGSWIICPTICYRKSKISSFSFDPRWKFMLDVAFMTEVLMAGSLIVGSKTSAYKYRRHSENQTSKLTKSSVRFIEQISFLNEVHKTAQTMKWKKSTQRSKRKVGIRVQLILQSIAFVFDKDILLAKGAIQSALSGKNCFGESRIP
jgi:glycosyltransferase involved in cell wall biosynthesis